MAGMTVSTQYQPIWYKPAAAMSPEPIAWQFLDAEQVLVTHIDAVTGAETVLVLGDDYSIGGSGPDGTGTITAIASWPVNDDWRVERQTKAQQEYDISPFESLRSVSLEQESDRQIMLIQETVSTLSRAILAPVGDEIGNLPSAASRAGKFALWDATGSNILNSNGTGADAGLREDLVDPAIGGDIVAYRAEPTFITRTFLEKMRETTSFKDDGALGDGLQDDSDFLQSVIDQWANSSPGRELTFPHGEFKVTKPLVFPDVTNARIVINGGGSRIFSTHNGPLFDMQNDFAFMRDIWLYGPGKTNVNSIGFKGSLFAGGIDNVRIDNFHTNLKIKTITGAIRRLHTASAVNCLWIEDFSNIISLDDFYMSSSDNGIYIPNTSGDVAPYVAQLALKTGASEVMGRSVYVPNGGLNRFSAHTFWTEQETIASVEAVDVPAIYTNSNFVTFQPVHTFTGGFPDASKTVTFDDAYGGRTVKHYGTSPATPLQLEAKGGYPDSPPIRIMGRQFAAGSEYNTGIGFGRNGVVMYGPQFLPEVGNAGTIGNDTYRFLEAHFSSNIKIGGNQIITTRQPAVADAVNAAAAPTQAEFNALVAQFNALLARVRTHGLIA